jgi:hypothetical protein
MTRRRWWSLAWQTLRYTRPEPGRWNVLAWSSAGGLREIALPVNVDPASVICVRNGLVQLEGVDYTLTQMGGEVRLTIEAGSQPGSGDTFQVRFYRL